MPWISISILQGSVTTWCCIHPTNHIHICSSHSRLILIPYYHRVQFGYKLHHEWEEYTSGLLPKQRSQRITVRCVRAYRNLQTDQEPIAILTESIQTSDVPVRVRYCFTSEVLVLKCDCKEQLDYAIAYIQQNFALSFICTKKGEESVWRTRLRTIATRKRYRHRRCKPWTTLTRWCSRISCAAKILDDIGIQSISHWPTTHEKLNAFQNLASTFVGVFPLIPASPSSSLYLETKRKRMGHLLSSHRTK